MKRTRQAQWEHEVYLADQVRMGLTHMHAREPLLSVVLFLHQEVAKAVTEGPGYLTLTVERALEELNREINTYRANAEP